jgi:hypothetical protein
MIKRIIRKVMFGMACMLCMTFYCECSSDDEHHHDHDGDNPHQYSLRQDEQHKGNKAENLSAPAESLDSAIADACEIDIHSLVSSANPDRKNNADVSTEKKEQLGY